MVDGRQGYFNQKQTLKGRSYNPPQAVVRVCVWRRFQNLGKTGFTRHIIRNFSNGPARRPPILRRKVVLGYGCVTVKNSGSHSQFQGFPMRTTDNGLTRSSCHLSDTDTLMKLKHVIEECD